MKRNAFRILSCYMPLFVSPRRAYSLVYYIVSIFFSFFFFIGFYLFLFVPHHFYQRLSEKNENMSAELNVTEDVAGATVMAAASSSPELFINVIGTFVTEGDLGVGTIVGSAVFNILAVPACCALFANEVQVRLLRRSFRFHFAVSLSSTMGVRRC